MEGIIKKNHWIGNVYLKQNLEQLGHVNRVKHKSEKCFKAGQVTEETE